MTGLIELATYQVTPDDLARMVLVREDLPADLQEFETHRKRQLDNILMAENSFPGYTSERLRDIGHIMGSIREFTSPSLVPLLSTEGTNLMAATAAHMFENKEQ